METNDIEFWRGKSNEWEWLFKEQKDICDGYRQIIKEKDEMINELRLTILKIKPVND